MKKEWLIEKADLNESLIKTGDSFGLSYSLISILFRRGYTNSIDIDRFLNRRVSDLHNAFLMKDMKQAVERLRKAVDDKERIGIFSDSDLDGLTSLTILVKLFTKLGVTPDTRYTETDENYGLSVEIIDEFIDKKINLLITLDSGTRDVQEISYARANGIDVIVIDHHEQGEKLPDAIVINPHRHDCRYPFKNLAGVGVAFKFITAFLYSYLKAYDRTFILVVEDNGIFFTSEFVNGTIISEKQYRVFEDLKEFLESIPSTWHIVFFEKNKKSESLNNGNDCIFLEDIILTNSFSESDDGFEEIFKLHKGLETKHQAAQRLFSNNFLFNSEKLKDFFRSLLELVAIGTIADVVSMNHENRILVSHGIESLRQSNHPGLKKIISDNRVDSKFIGWSIAPLLNTPGRIGKTELTASFFSEDNEARINDIIQELRQLNIKRKEDLNKIFNNLMAKLDAEKVESNKKMIAIKEDVPDGLTGLLANRISDKTGKPVIIFSLPGKNNVLKGSGRYIGSSEFFPHVAGYSHLFERVGGHANAFGFSIHEENISILIESIEKSLSDFDLLNNVLNIDCELNIESINPQFIDSLSALEPFGKENPEPLFLSRNIHVDEFQTCGNENVHGRFRINNCGSQLSAIGWNMADTMNKIFLSQKKIDLVYRLENNFFRGNVYPQMIIVDMDISQN